MKAKFTKVILLLSLVVLSGCVASNPTMVSHWIPPGTSQEDAIRIMEQHGYESGPCGGELSWPKGEAVYCFWHDNNFLKQSYYFFVRFKDGKLDSIVHHGISSTFVVKPERLTPILKTPTTPPDFAPSPK